MRTRINLPKLFLISVFTPSLLAVLVGCGYQVQATPASLDYLRVEPLVNRAEHIRLTSNDDTGKYYISKIWKSYQNSPRLDDHAIGKGPPLYHKVSFYDAHGLAYKTIAIEVGEVFYDNGKRYDGSELMNWLNRVSLHVGGKPVSNVEVTIIYRDVPEQEAIPPQFWSESNSGGAPNSTER